MERTQRTPGHPADVFQIVGQRALLLAEVGQEPMRADKWDWMDLVGRLARELYDEIVATYPEMWFDPKHDLALHNMRMTALILSVVARANSEGEVAERLDCVIYLCSSIGGLSKGLREHAAEMAAALEAATEVVEVAHG